MQHTASLVQIAASRRSPSLVAGVGQALRGFRHYTLGDDERCSTRDGPAAGRRWFEQSILGGLPWDACRDHGQRR